MKPWSGESYHPRRHPWLEAGRSMTNFVLWFNKCLGRIVIEIEGMDCLIRIVYLKISFDFLFASSIISSLLSISTTFPFVPTNSANARTSSTSGLFLYKRTRLIETKMSGGFNKSVVAYKAYDLVLYFFFSHFSRL